MQYPLHNNTGKMEWEVERGIDPFTLSFEDKGRTDRKG